MARLVSRLVRFQARGWAVAAGARRLDDEAIARRQLGAIAAGEQLHAAVPALHPVLADPAVGAARRPARRGDAVVRQDRGGHRREEADAPHGAVATPPAPRAAGAGAEPVLLDPHRE